MSLTQHQIILIVLLLLISLLAFFKYSHLIFISIFRFSSFSSSYFINSPSAYLISFLTIILSISF